MRQALTAGSGMDGFASNLSRLHDARIAILVASSLAPMRRRRVPYLIDARLRSSERSVERSREHSPERSSPPEPSPREAAGERP